jgi:hypothetical protein
VVSSEKNFDRQDGHKQKDDTKKKLCDYLEVNIGTSEEPKFERRRLQLHQSLKEEGCNYTKNDDEVKALPK